MAQPIEHGSWWMYVGPGGGSGVKHKVIYLTAGNVITWSQFSPNPEEGGDSWLGPRHIFLTHFMPAQ